MRREKVHARDMVIGTVMTGESYRERHPPVSRDFIVKGGGQIFCTGCYLHSASYLRYGVWVPKRAKTPRRSACPVSISLEMFGDRWSLLIIRDLMVRGLRTFKEFLQSGEGIASNILSNRLERLEATGIIATEADACDGRKVIYQLTEKGMDLAPIMLELLIWGARHETTGVSCDGIGYLKKNRARVLKEVRRRWLARDPTPLLPSFGRGQE